MKKDIKIRFEFLKDKKVSEVKDMTKELLGDNHPTFPKYVEERK